MCLTGFGQCITNSGPYILLRVRVFFELSLQGPAVMRDDDKQSEGFDAVDLEIIWSQLITLVDEAAHAVRRTSMSKVVVEGADFGVLLYDAKGRLLASDFAIASKISTIAVLAEKILGVIPAEDLHPGDVIITNNPWWVMGHLNDLAVFSPIFFQDKLVGFAECLAHMADIGGCLSARPRDLFEEGLIIPPVKAVERGRENDMFFTMLRANIRVPDQVLSDVRALITGCRVLEAKLGEFLKSRGLADLDGLAPLILDRSEAAMRQGIKKNIPDGRYFGETGIDGFDEALHIRVRVDVRDGQADLDFTGTSPQNQFGINCTELYSAVWTAFTIKSVAAPHLPNNEGTFRPIRFSAPERTLLNPLFPAPVKMKPSTGHYIPIAILNALSEVVPERMLAESGKKSLLYLAGRGADGKPFSDLAFVMGGMAARAAKDGLHSTSFPGNTGSIPVEVLEALAPIRVRHKRLRPDSGGAGRFRGGCGTDFEFESLSDAPLTVQAEHGKLNTAPAGLRGGGNGAVGRTSLNGQTVPDKSPLNLQRGDVLRMEIPGSGGMYPPSERDPAAIARDLENGIISPEAAQRDYGFHAGAAKR